MTWLFFGRAERFRSLQVGSSTQCVVFGDSAYIRQLHIMSYFSDADMPAAAKYLNYAVKTTRTGFFDYFVLFSH